MSFENGRLDMDKNSMVSEIKTDAQWEVDSEIEKKLRKKRKKIKKMKRAQKKSSYVSKKDKKKLKKLKKDYYNFQKQKERGEYEYQHQMYQCQNELMKARMAALFYQQMLAFYCSGGKGVEVEKIEKSFPVLPDLSGGNTNEIQF